MLFKDAQNSRRPWPHHQSFRLASLRSPSSKTGGAAKGIPVLKTTKLVLFCSPRDRLIVSLHVAGNGRRNGSTMQRGDNGH